MRKIDRLLERALVGGQNAKLRLAKFLKARDHYFDTLDAWFLESGNPIILDINSTDCLVRPVLKLFKIKEGQGYFSWGQLLVVWPDPENPLRFPCPDWCQPGEGIYERMIERFNIEARIRANEYQEKLENGVRR